ncbi:MAG: TlpA family protein disulfide reductase [Pseudomonadales bacterium]|nr:TlpA family protein disulfide reductase [Pseudomonadales bacterium]
MIKVQVDNSIKLVFAAALVFFSLASNAAGVQDTAPDFTLKNLEGKNLRLQEFRGQVVLLNFWASWCGPCRQEMPLLDRIHQRYEDAGFSVVAVNVEGEKAPAQALAKETGVSFPVLIDTDQKVSEQYNLEAMPSSVLIDRDGVIRYIHRGYQPGDESHYLKVVKQLIKE